MVYSLRLTYSFIFQFYCLVVTLTTFETYKQFYLSLISEYPSSDFFFTDGSKTEAGVAAAAVSTKYPRKPLTCRLRSLYTAELRAILLALKRIYCSKRKSILILSDSLSLLKAIFNLNYEHPVLVQNLELYMDLTKDGKEVVFVWVPGHVGIRGNSAADAAAKDALVGDTSVEFIPFSDLKTDVPTNIY